MSRPQNRELRVFRLASLLTGSSQAAVRVMESVLQAQPDVRQVDDAHLDRLTVLRSRELFFGQIVDDRLDPPVAGCLASMTSQQREAWIFAHVLHRPMRSIARAMDCSVTATERHLARAEELAAEQLGTSVSEAAESLCRFVNSLELPEFFLVRRARRRRAQDLLVAALLLLLAIGAILFSLWVNW